VRKILLTGFLTAGLLTPALSYAQPAAKPAPAPPSVQVLQIDVPQWLAIGAGIVAGAVVLNALLPDEVAYLVVGGVAGYLVTIWYNGGQVEIHAATAPKT